MQENDKERYNQTKYAVHNCLKQYGTINKKSYPRRNIILEIEAKEKATKCECLDFMNGAYGNCKKDYKYWNRSICYISATACCEDKKWSSSAGKHYSWTACNPKASKNCDWMIGY